MPKTHNFEISINGHNEITGQINFNGGEEPSVSVYDETSMCINEWSLILDMFKQMIKINHNCGNIEKIEVNLIV